MHPWCLLDPPMVWQYISCGGVSRIVWRGWPSNYSDKFSCELHENKEIELGRGACPCCRSPNPPMRDSLQWRFKGASLARAPYDPKFSQFHAVFRKICKNHMLAPFWRVGAPSYGESCIRPCPGSVPNDVRDTYHILVPLYTHLALKIK